MSTIDEVKQLQSQGMTEENIVNTLKQKGVAADEISTALSQMKIKSAVSGPETGQAPGGDVQAMSAQAMGGQQPQQITPQPTGEVSQLPPTGGQGTNIQQQPFQQQEVSRTQEMGGGGYEGMQPSLSTQPEEPQGETQDYSAGGNYGPESYSMTGQEDYGQYPQYQESMSSDVIAEIAEQIINEKLSEVRESLEKTLDFRTMAESQIESLNERLKKIENMIDQLQLSVLQKVGDYVNDVKDLKKEVIETQKSFKAINQKRHP